MAALASTAVALYPLGVGPNATANGRPNVIYHRDGTNRVTKSLKLTLVAQGDATDTIGADALGFSVLLDCSTLWDAQNGASYQTVIDPVNNRILLCAAASEQPAVVSSTAAYITVTGLPKGVSAT